MSDWASATGVIEIYYIISPKLNEKILLKILKNKFIQSTPECTDLKCNMPLGSEGSIQREIIFNKNNMKVHIMLFGSLRDVGEKVYHCCSLEDIQNWFIKSIKDIDTYFGKLGELSVGNCTLFIRDDYQNISIIYNPYETDKQFHIIKLRIKK